MAPVPLEGIQTTAISNMSQGGGGGGGGYATPQEGNRGGQISLAMLIDFIVQRTYHELTVLAELLPRKTDMERKIEIYTFATRTRQLFVRLLALVKWASSASKVEKSARIMAFLDKQSLLFVETADMLARMARETLVQARLPNFHIPAAVEVLTTGTYGRLPSCIRDRIVPPDPITNVEKKTTLSRLNQVIQHRLVTGNLLPQMRNLKIENGRVTFHVEREFEVSLTVMGDGPNIPWRLLEIDILVEDKETGDGKVLVHTLQVQYIHQLIQSRLVDNPHPLTEVYNCLHFFCQSLQLEVFYTQTLRLMRDRLDDHIHVDEYVPGKCLTVSYWRELTNKGKELINNKDLRSELGYKLTIQVDPHDSARPLTVQHIPSLGIKESEIADRAIRSEFLSMERLLVHTIYVRTRSRLSEIKQELQGMLKNVDSNLQGSPAILSVAILQPCLRAEQLLVTVDTHSGMLQCQVPQYEAPLIPELQNSLNGDHVRLPVLITELRYWITQRRCEKTLQHLPATAHERLPLLHHPDHPLTKIGRHRMYVQLHRHPNVILIVELKEKENFPCEVGFSFYLAVVKHSSIEDNPDDDSIETEIPKVYLKVQSLIELDTFVVTHGPFTNVDEEIVESDANSLKRKSTSLKMDSIARRSKQPAYFISELAHVVAMCDERLPYITLTKELTNRNIFHQGLQVEANATGLVLRLIQMPPPNQEIGLSAAWQALLKRMLSASIRVQSKGMLKSWMTEFVFYSSPLISSHPKEQGNRRPVYFQYDMGTIENINRTVDSLLDDWYQIVHLYTIVHDLSEYISTDKYNLSNMFSVKSYNYSKLILYYGSEKGAIVSINWNNNERAFQLAFGANNNALNAHSLIREQLEGHLNQHRNLAQIIQLLNESYEPLISISKLPSLPQLGVYNTRPQVPVQTFTVMAQSCTLVRLAYQGMYCLELRLRGGGLVSLRDGAYSRYDRSNVVDVFTPTQGLKAFLSKYVDESALFRRRSQSEDDNPPSPISMEVEGGGGGGGFLMGHHKGPQSPAQQRGETTGLRFHTPLTPPSGSNPHTPASPHTGGGGHASSFSLASPTNVVNPSPLPAMPHPSPGGSGLVAANSPLNQHVASSPGGGLLSNSSPNATNLPGHSPGSSGGGGGAGSGTGFMQQTNDGSPFPSSSQSMTSPAASNWPGSPSVPRPSPARPGQSPAAGPIMHSPQSVGMAIGSAGGGGVGVGHLSRVLPQRSWAGAVPTLLTHEALETLCCPSPHPQGLPGPELAPLERFLGCVYMRRQLQRFVHNENYLTAVQTTEPGVIHFKVADTLLCRIGLNTQHLQSLHLKITPTQESKDVWSPEELQIIEKFFDLRAAAPPYKPISMFGFCCLLNVPVNILKDFVQIMRLDLMPQLCQQQGFKWSVQWMLRIPPSAIPIVPTGMAAVLYHKSKILFFLQITRIGIQYPNNMEPPSLVLPLVYDTSTNITQLPEKQHPGPAPAMTAASQLLKHFAQFQSNHSECSLLPAVRELLLNLTLPNDPQQANNPGLGPVSVPVPVPVPVVQQQIQSPAMQMAQGGQPGYSVNMPMGMMPPQ